MATLRFLLLISLFGLFVLETAHCQNHEKSLIMHAPKAKIEIAEKTLIMMPCNDSVFKHCRNENFEFEMPRRGHALIFITNDSGRLIEILLDSILDNGKYGINYCPDNLTRGMYYFKQLMYDTEIKISKLYYSGHYTRYFGSPQAFTYNLSDSCNIQILLFDANNQLIDTLVNIIDPPGFYYIDIFDKNLPPGTYFYNAKICDSSMNKKIIKK